MNHAVELYKKDGTSAGIFFCSQCRIVHPTQAQAEWCHGERLCSCGNKIKQGYSLRKCGECETKEFRAKEEAKENERFEEATKISESEYRGAHVYCGDSYYESVEEAVDQFLEGQEPEYVWACRDHGIPTVDIEEATCNIIDNMWDDAEVSDLNGVEELEAALATFNEANKSIQIWEPDYSTAILVQKKA